MKRKVLVIGKKNQLGSELITRIIAALKTSKLITEKEQVHYLTLDVLGKIPEISVKSQTTTTLMVGLKEITSTDLVRRINYAHKKARVLHLVVNTEGVDPTFAEEDNASVYKTLEALAKKDFSLEVAA